MELQIQDLKNKLIEKDNKIKDLEEQLKIFIDRYEKNKKYPRKKYYEENKDIIIQKAKESQIKLKNENPELYKERNRKASLKSYYKKKQNQEITND
jgi:hypothetical protein